MGIRWNIHPPGIRPTFGPWEKGPIFGQASKNGCLKEQKWAVVALKDRGGGSVPTHGGDAKGLGKPHWGVTRSGAPKLGQFRVIFAI